MKRLVIYYSMLFALLFSQMLLAGTGTFFNIVSTGSPANLDITLCLNGKGPLSCQNYQVSALNLSITTTIPNHTYPAAGIKINTPGFFPTGCTPINNGYCLFSVSNTTSANLTIGSTHTFSLGGSVSGLNGTVVLQNNGGDSLSISQNGPFVFSTPVTEGQPYVVTVLTQPNTQTCNVVNGSGIMDNADVTNVAVNCVTNTTTLSVAALGTIPVNNGSNTLTVTNTGTNPAFNVAAVLPNTWVNVIQGTCPTIAANGGTCNLTFSSTTPYIAQGNISVTGSNITGPAPTTALAFTVSGYLVWSVDSPTSVSVIDTADLASTRWGAFGVVTGAQSNTDGQSNTTIIVGTAGIGASAAVSCNNDTSGGAPTGTWYLPAICQLGPDVPGGTCPGGTANIFTNLAQFGFGNFVDTAGQVYWASTEDPAAPDDDAFVQQFTSPTTIEPATTTKNGVLRVRCARSLTF